MNFKYTNLIENYYAVKNSATMSYSYSKTGFFKSDIFLFKEKDDTFSSNKIHFQKYEINNIRLWKRNKFRNNLENGINIEVKWKF